MEAKKAVIVYHVMSPFADKADIRVTFEDGKVVKFARPDDLEAQRWVKGNFPAVKVIHTIITA